MISRQYIYIYIVITGQNEDLWSFIIEWSHIWYLWHRSTYFNAKLHFHRGAFRMCIWFQISQGDEQTAWGTVRRRIHSANDILVASQLYGCSGQVSYLYADGILMVAYATSSHRVRQRLRTAYTCWLVRRILLDICDYSTSLPHSNINGTQLS